MRQRQGTSRVMLLVLGIVVAICSTTQPTVASDQDTPKLGDRARFPQPVMVAVANFPPEEIRTSLRTFRTGDRCKIDAGYEVEAYALDGSRVLVYLDYRTPTDGVSCPRGTVFWLREDVFAAMKAVHQCGTNYTAEELAALLKSAGLKFE